MGKYGYFEVIFYGCWTFGFVWPGGSNIYESDREGQWSSYLFSCLVIY